MAKKQTASTAVAEDTQSKAIPNRKADVRILSGNELSPSMSFDFNCRSPSKHSKAYKAMRDTLKEAPEEFLQQNGGIVAAGRYILDGGHTYLAIRDAINEDGVDPSRIHVRLLDYGELSKDEMAQRSVSLNRRVTPPLAGERDILGHWDKLKAHSKKTELFEFRPNTNPDAKYDVSFLVALVDGWKSTTAEKSYSGKGNLVRLYTDDKYAALIPLLGTMQDVYSTIYEKLADDAKLMKTLAGYAPAREVVLPNGKRVSGAVPESYVWPIYGAFRSLIGKSGDFDVNPLELLDKKWGALTKQLKADYKRVGSNPGAYGKDKEVYLNTTIALLGNR